jgi:L-alanine-DL-glutamate epimerase-like enolase superfamily enzyme
MIRVTAAEAVPITFRLVEGYRIAGRSFHDAFNVILKIATADGRTGFGCASPGEEVTGESREGCLHALRDRLVPLLRESDAADPVAFAARARAAAPAAPAARAAAEIALWDLRARRAGVALVRLLGMRRGFLPTSVTLGVAGEEETVERARRFAAAGFGILKVKVGEDWEADARLIRRLRDALGPDVVLRADANEGYAEDQARRFLGALPAGSLELLEQPVARGDDAALRRLADDHEVPIMADEAVHDAGDAGRLAAARAADLVNIKLMKTGGLVEAGRVAAIAAASGLRAMAGCMDESRIGIAAALHWALATEAVDRADLDGSLDLADDVARDGFRLDRGRLIPLYDRPGLGVSVDL